MLSHSQSRLLACVPPSQSIAAAQRARDLKAAGHDLVSVTIGEPDFPTPPQVIEAALQAARAGETRYTPVPGTIALREAVARKFQTENALDYDPALEILVGTGAKQVLYEALTATTNPGDEIIVPAPYWVSYPTIARLVGAAPVFIQTRAEHGFVPTPDDLEAAITPRTRWLILNYPNNPSGAVASMAQYEGLAAVLERHPGIRVLSDEIYEHICYEGSTFTSFAAVSAAMKARTVVVNGVSKSYGMTGWRIGYAGGPRELISAMAKLQSHITGGACAVSQAAAAAALGMGTAEPLRRTGIYQMRRDLVVGWLRNCPRLQVHEPKGAFYVFVKIEDADRLGGREVDDYLLDYGVAVIAGTAFGAPGWFRISIATSESELQQACERIQRAFAA